MDKMNFRIIQNLIVKVNWDVLKILEAKYL